jgi:hypothetical protein
MNYYKFYVCPHIQNTAMHHYFEVYGTEEYKLQIKLIKIILYSLQIN